MTIKPAISVIMPCFNTAKYLSSSIESVLGQSFSDFEFVIINDGSTDNSDSIIRNYTNDKRTKYIRLNKNLGNYFARNIGLKAAKGKYICIMDSDDSAVYNRLKIQHTYLEKRPWLGGVGGQGELIDGLGAPMNNRINRPICSWRQLQTLFLKDNYILHPSVMFRAKSISQKLTYNEAYRYASDFDFFSRYVARFPFVNISEMLIKYRLHGSQISTERYMEQTRFADSIRLKQLARFKIELSSNDKKIYLMLMKEIRFDRFEEVKLAERLLNRMLKKNKQLKLFNDDYLFRLFEYLLLSAYNMR